MVLISKEALGIKNKISVTSCEVWAKTRLWAYSSKDAQHTDFNLASYLRPAFTSNTTSSPKAHDEGRGMCEMPRVAPKLHFKSMKD